MLWLVLLAILLISVLFLVFLTQNLIYPRPRFNTWNRETYPIEYSKGIAFIYDQNSINSETTILFSHGNGCTIIDLDNIREYCRKIGVNLLIYDYFGYGASQEVRFLGMDRSVLIRSISIAYNVVRKRSQGKVILMGQSLGCYPTSWLASQLGTQISGVILCVPFDKLSNVIHRFTGFSYFSGLTEEIDNLALMKDIRAPTLIISARGDRIIPSNSGYNLHRAITAKGLSQLLYVNSGHNDYFTEEVQDKVTLYIRNL